VGKSTHKQLYQVEGQEHADMNANLAQTITEEPETEVQTTTEESKPEEFKPEETIVMSITHLSFSCKLCSIGLKNLKFHDRPQYLGFAISFISQLVGQT